MCELCKAEVGAGGTEKRQLRNVSLAGPRHAPTPTPHTRETNIKLFSDGDIVRTQSSMQFFPLRCQWLAYTLTAILHCKKLCSLLFIIFARSILRYCKVKLLPFNFEAVAPRVSLDPPLNFRATEEARLKGDEETAHQSEPLNLFPLLKMTWNDRKRPQLPTHPLNSPH